MRLSDHDTDNSSTEPEVTSTSGDNISTSRTPNVGESLELVEKNDMRGKQSAYQEQLQTLNTFLGNKGHHHHDTMGLFAIETKWAILFKKGIESCYL